jgi:hypothetical protein
MDEGNRVTDRTGLVGNPKGRDPYEGKRGSQKIRLPILLPPNNLTQ